MLTENDKKFWIPLPDVVEWVSTLIDEGANVLEIGPGVTPFSRASHFVDWQPGTNITPCDINRDRLPFADKQFDFIYCRHVLEDLYNPFLVCDEMSRVGKAGYIETPSPLAEVCRGIDGGSPKWRGYHHHRYFVWNDDGVLNFAGKYPAIESFDFGDETMIEDFLRKDPMLWNTYFVWRDTLQWKHLQHDIDFKVYNTYRAVIAKAMKHGMNNAADYRNKIRSEVTSVSA